MSVRPSDSIQFRSESLSLCWIFLASRNAEKHEMGCVPELPLTDNELSAQIGEGAMKKVFPMSCIQERSGDSGYHTPTMPCTTVLRAPSWNHCTRSLKMYCANERGNRSDSFSLR
eukprot:1260491-Amphidinium_carterae.1